MSKFKEIADDKIIVTQNLTFTFGRVENIVGKGENAGYQYFLFFPQCFQMLSFDDVLKFGIVCLRDEHDKQIFEKYNKNYYMYRQGKKRNDSNHKFDETQKST